MNSKESNTARELSTIELDQVSGGDGVCTCGWGAGCVEYVGSWQMDPWAGFINCSAYPVSPFQN
jgi:hypothetical protein